MLEVAIVAVCIGWLGSRGAHLGWPVSRLVDLFAARHLAAGVTGAGGCGCHTPSSLRGSLDSGDYIDPSISTTRKCAVEGLERAPWRPAHGPDTKLTCWRSRSCSRMKCSWIAQFAGSETTRCHRCHPASLRQRGTALVNAAPECRARPDLKRTESSVLSTIVVRAAT